MNKEIKLLTGIRGIAALWVVFLHYFESINLNKDLYISKFFSNGIIAVDMFFLLSAFVMCLAYSEEFKLAIPLQKYKSFIKKRFARIYPAFFFWALIFLCFDFIKLNFYYSKILVNLLLIQNFFKDSTISGVFWSLSSEWLLYLIFPFLYYILQKVKYRPMNIFLVSVSFIGLYFLPSLNNYFFDFQKGFYMAEPSGFIGVVSGANSVFRCFFSYVIGINIFLLIKNYKIIYQSWIKFYAYCSILGIFVISYFGKSPETYILLLICSVVLISALYLDKENENSLFASKFVYFLGQISYSIYLCHMFILILVTILAKKFFFSEIDSVVQAYLVLGSLALIIPISYLSYLYIEVQAGNWLKSKLLSNLPKKGYDEKDLRPAKESAFK